MPSTELPAGPSRAPTGGGGGESPLTRKIGPLPAWGWAVVVAGAVLVARALGGSKGATGGQSVPGTLPVGGDLPEGGDIGLGGGTPGPQGPPGQAGPPGTLPTSYSSLLNQITDWFQQLSRTTQLINNLKDQIARTHDAAKKKKLQAALNKATGKTAVAGGKFTYNNTTYYQQSWLNNTINALQGQLTGLQGA